MQPSVASAGVHINAASPEDKGTVSALEKVGIDYAGKSVLLSIRTLDGQNATFETSYKEAFADKLQSFCGENGLEALDFQSLQNLVSLHLVSLKLANVGKKALRLIDAFSCSDLIEIPYYDDMYTALLNRFMVNCTKRALSLKETIGEKLNSVKELSQKLSSFEVYERDKLIEEVREKLFECLGRKHVLEVAMCHELMKKRGEYQLPEECKMVSELIRQEK